MLLFQVKWDVDASVATAGTDSGGGTFLLRVGRLEEEIGHQRKLLSESSMCSVVELAWDGPALPLSISMTTVATEQLDVLRSFRICLNFLEWSSKTTWLPTCTVNVAEFLQVSVVPVTHAVVSSVNSCCVSHSLWTAQ